MVVERFGCLGGNITVVGVESTAWYRREGTVDCEGIASSSRSPRDGVDGADVNVARPRAELRQRGVRLH